ncbi:UNVERIFIED_CONTAM: Chitin elicitor receptor kinase [Sesamum latifolium]|uniref:Chitin elicitor receptor kinase n=1 Tax=Sesamum latifolium TaxID=2727402 RepID=A0AAW2TM56_9LAMI
MDLLQCNYVSVIFSCYLSLISWLAPGDIKRLDSAGTRDGASPGLTGITVDKSVEFSYEELASATDNFSIANKIGEGGFGAVYYAELRGELSKKF